MGNFFKGYEDELPTKRQRKLLEIKKGEYLLDVTKDGVLTTKNKKVAMNISHWNLEQLGYVVSNLHKAGFVKARVIVEDIEEVELKDRIVEAVDEIIEDDKVSE